MYATVPMIQASIFVVALSLAVSLVMWVEVVVHREPPIVFPDSLTAITPRTPPSTLTIDEHRALLAEAMDYMLRAQADAHRAAIETTHSTARAAAHATAHAAEPPLDMDALTERLRSIVGDATSTVDYSTFRDPQYDQAPDIPHDEAAIIDGSFEFPWMTSDLTNTPNPYGTE